MDIFALAYSGYSGDGFNETRNWTQCDSVLLSFHSLNLQSGSQWISVNLDWQSTSTGSYRDLPTQDWIGGWLETFYAHNDVLDNLGFTNCTSIFGYSFAIESNWLTSKFAGVNMNLL